MRWILASESNNLPLEKVLHLRDNVELERLGNFYFDEETEQHKLYIQPNGAHDGYTVTEKHFDHYFYLDESESSSPSPLKDVIEEMGKQDPFKKYRHLAALKKEAETVMFASVKYWRLRCWYLEKTIDETYSKEERDNCRTLYMILNKRDI